MNEAGKKLNIAAENAKGSRLSFEWLYTQFCDIIIL